MPTRGNRRGPVVSRSGSGGSRNALNRTFERRIRENPRTARDRKTDSRFIIDPETGKLKRGAMDERDHEDYLNQITLVAEEIAREKGKKNKEYRKIMNFIYRFRRYLKMSKDDTLLREWRKNPGLLDVAGIDTAATDGEGERLLRIEKMVEGVTGKRFDKGLKVLFSPEEFERLEIELDRLYGEGKDSEATEYLENEIVKKLTPSGDGIWENPNTMKRTAVREENELRRALKNGEALTAFRNQLAITRLINAYMMLKVFGEKVDERLLKDSIREFIKDFLSGTWKERLEFEIGRDIGFSTGNRTLTSDFEVLKDQFGLQSRIDEIPEDEEERERWNDENWESHPDFNDLEETASALAEETDSVIVGRLFEFALPEALGRVSPDRFVSDTSNIERKSLDDLISAFDMLRDLQHHGGSVFTGTRAYPRSMEFYEAIPKFYDQMSEDVFSKELDKMADDLDEMAGEDFTEFGDYD